MTVYSKTVCFVTFGVGQSDYCDSGKPFTLLCIVGMSAKHCKALRLSRSELLRCVKISEGLLSELISREVITRPIKDEIDVSIWMYNAAVMFRVTIHLGSPG